MVQGVLVHVLGVKAVGKSTLIAEFKRQTGLKVIELTFGDFMLEIAQREKGVKDREALSKMGAKQVRDMQMKAAAKIRSMLLEKPSQIVFLNNHGFFYEQPHHMLLPGSHDALVEILPPDLVLLVEAKPEEILRRRKMDLKSGVRAREVGSLNDVKVNLDAERHVGIHLAQKFGVPLKVFDHTLPVAKNRQQFLELAQTFEAVAAKR
ncbi:MAG TPA: AAA family ATPase [Candidatus Norongarragalinales archaeon]|jgi:adenylate kinase|nr:AAA family ATPase [Candidatus Norongarragalinales archaeon]